MFAYLYITFYNSFILIAGFKIRNYLKKIFTPIRKVSLFNWLLLIKATLIIVIIPFVMLTVYGIYGALGTRSIFYGALASFIIALFVVRPYLTDLSALIAYVENLAFDRKTKAPNLSFLSNFAKLSGALGHLHDSWQKKRVQLETLVTESKILFDLLPDILITLDDDLRIIRTNSAAHNTFRRRMTHMKLEEVIPDPLLMSFVKWVLHDKKGKDLELYLPEPLNRYYIVRIEKFPILSLGGISLIIIMHDITESKHTERMLSDFVANASHEIRTPLATMIGFIETLQTTAKDDDIAREQFLKIMASQGERMAQLVSDLLSLSKIEMNANTPPSEDIEIDTLLQKVIEQHQWSAREYDTRIEAFIDDNLPAIKGDSHELIQLFTNLLSNALKYGERSSVITVKATTGTATLNEHTHAEALPALIISFQDQGDGIDKEHLPRLTERFYRVDNPRARRNKISGTGLGLSIVKQILRRHQGRLGIESTVGEGSIFTVYLPLTASVEKP